MVELQDRDGIGVDLADAAELVHLSAVTSIGFGVGRLAECMVPTMSVADSVFSIAGAVADVLGPLRGGPDAAQAATNITAAAPNAGAANRAVALTGRF